MASDKRASRASRVGPKPRSRPGTPGTPGKPGTPGRIRSSRSTRGVRSHTGSPARDEFVPVIPGYFIVEHSDNLTFPVNSNCISKLIYEYIRVKVGIPDDFEFDLCDEDGNPVDLYDKEEGSYAYNHFVHKRKYYIFLLERGKNGFLFNPRLMLNANDPEFQRIMRALMKIFARLSTERKKKKKQGKDFGPFHKHHRTIF